MWSGTKGTLLMAAAVLLFGGATASAAVLNVKVPFPFVVQGHPFPAGQYLVQRDETDPSVLLIRGKTGSAAGMFVLTRTAAGHDPAGGTPALTFTQHENTYSLADIWESASLGQEVPGTAQATAAKPASKHTPVTHATRGVVKSVDGSTLVITSTGKGHGEMTFTLSPSTHREGTVIVGAPVSVRYREEGKRYIATAIRVQQPAQQSAHAAPSKQR